MTKLLAIFAALIATVSLCASAQNPAQTAPPQPAAPAQPATEQKPTTRPPVQAKNQAEYQAYQAAIANEQNPEAMEKAADDFAAKFPDSDLRVLLYRAAMHSYQTTGNSDKMMETGLKLLAIDRDDPEGLIVVAEVQEEHTSPTDLDRDQRMSQAIEGAQHALQTIDTDLAVPSGTPSDKVEAYKRYLRATALTIVGTIQYKREQYADAEATLQKAIDTDPSNPDAVVILRLALALDQQKKYPEALRQANRAVELTKEDTDIGKMARNERERLVLQTGGDNTRSPNAGPSDNPPGADGTNGNTGNPAAPANVPPGSTPPTH
jgi:tetratricopeptide (TPR) repeat protein